MWRTNREKMIDSLTGRKVSDKTKKKISESNKGKLVSEYTKNKMRQSRKDKKPTLGKTWKLSLEARIKNSESHKGAKSHLWRGGIYENNLQNRKSLDSTLWKEKVFKRDSWTCQKCKEKGGKLNAHHIKNFSKYIKLRFDISNGITFCKECHKEFHKRYGFENNNIEQIKEFLEKLC